MANADGEGSMKPRHAKVLGFPGPPTDSTEFADASSAARRRRVDRLCVAVLIVGFAGAAVAAFIARQRPANPFGYEPLQTKRYVHDLEVYGGHANVLAEQFREWFKGLWYGTHLAYTIAVLTVMAVLAIRLLALPPPLPPAAAPGPRQSGGAGRNPL